MPNDSRFNIVLASPSEYERLVAEIYFEGKFVALVSQEAGLGEFEVELPDADLTESSLVRRVELKGFLASLAEASRRLGADE